MVLGGGPPGKLPGWRLTQTAVESPSVWALANLERGRQILGAQTRRPS